jgi:hypothetical protein
VAVTPKTPAETAQVFLAAANALGAGLDALDALGRDGHPLLQDERTNAETVVDHGEDVLYALRTLAMRLDRAALLNAPPEA